MFESLRHDERAGLVWPMTDVLRMEAAMVVWEAFRDLQSAEPGAIGPLNTYHDKVGSVVARHDMMPVAEALHIGWHVHELAAGEDVKTAFDGEFARWFLRACFKFDERGWIARKPDWLELCRATRCTF